MQKAYDAYANKNCTEDKFLKSVIADSLQYNFKVSLRILNKFGLGPKVYGSEWPIYFNMLREMDDVGDTADIREKLNTFLDSHLLGSLQTLKAYVEAA